MLTPRLHPWLVSLCGLLPTLLLIVASRGMVVPQDQLRERQALEMAALPAKAAEAPLLSGYLGQEAALADPAAMALARALNARMPFAQGLVAPAPAFRFGGSLGDRDNARDCLALAAMAEAGPSDRGQRAVMQVILNRVRHPAFAKTVCGVVFEGSQRRTGCQFTFTCDGSLARRHADLAWALARQRADEALSGHVFAAVGTATHYHTDWVFPSWSPRLEKIAQIETHLFFRWPGQWGRATSWQAHYRGGEPSFLALVAGSDPEAMASGMTGLDDASAANARLPLPSDTPRISGGQVVMRLPSGRANFIVVVPGAGGEVALANARRLCTGTGTCRVLGWDQSAAIPANFPLTGQARASLRFSFTRDPAGGEIVLYDCNAFAGVPRDLCIPRGR